MNNQKDSTLQLYVDESLEHLSNIENDFLTIEENGKNINEELVNKVFRAAHSIKGGAGFIGLNKINELAHKMENVLGMMRSRKLAPNTEIVNVLLSASDTLRDMINNLSTSNETDISNHVKALISITEGSFAEEKQEPTELEPESKSISNTFIDVAFPEEANVFSVEKNKIEDAWQEGRYVYLIKFSHSHIKNKNWQDITNEMQASGIILADNADSINVDSIDDKAQSDYAALFACVLEPNNIGDLLEIDKKNIFELAKDFTATPIEKEKTDIVKHEEVKEIKKEVKPAPEKPKIEKPKTKEIADKPKINNVKLAKDIEASLRIPVKLLDSLMALAGELVLSRNQLLQATLSNDYNALENVSQKIDLTTSKLQENIMLTRMQPVGNIFNKFPRIVRDLAGKLGKEIEFIIKGSDIELDKTIIEDINDPLTHLIRNAVDHGIETPEERENAQKNAKGKITLQAYHGAGYVNVVISDDGKGIDGDQLSRIAVSKGLISAEQSMIMSSKEKLNLIFTPGFSTVENATDISGRGVGMDVVKTNVDKLGGQINIVSMLGKGTKIYIKLPLTLTIISSQIVLNQGERYAIPQVNVEELIRIPANQVKRKIEQVGDAEVLRLRGTLLPLVRLSDVIGIKRKYWDTNEKPRKDKRQSIADRRSKKSPLFKENLTEDFETENQDTANRTEIDRRLGSANAFNIVAVFTGVIKYGLIVDALCDSEEIVVKPLGRHLKKCKGYTGAAIMGDGKIALILDAGNLATMAGLSSVEGTSRAEQLARNAEADEKAEQGKQSLLIFRSSDNEQFAAPLEQVTRIERIKIKDIEEAGGKRIIKYKGGNLIVFSIDEAANVKPLSNKDHLIVIVFAIANSEIGLLSVDPVDAVETHLTIDDFTLKQRGIKGSTIIKNHTTSIIDILELTQLANPEWFAKLDFDKAQSKKTATLLMVEDSNFFRHQVKSFIEEEGYKVIEAEDGLIAWELLNKHKDEISLVVTDIEMPNLDGFELTEKIKKDKNLANIPVISLTTLAGDEDIARGKRVGIDDYQIKLDKEKLIESIGNHLKT